MKARLTCCYTLSSKHKLNILDIPIVELLSQYMDAIQAMREADMDVTSEFVEMASRLVYLKTVSPASPA